MSAGKSWYKRNPLDFINGTLKLSLEEKGAYSLILDLIYSHGSPIADDARYLAGVCNISLRKWASLRDRLVEMGKITIRDGFISNARAEEEIKKIEEVSQKLSESGAKGGRNRAENSSKSERNLNETSLKHEDKSTENEDEFNKNNNLSQARLKHTYIKDKDKDKDIDISSLRSEIVLCDAQKKSDFLGCDFVEDLGEPPESSRSKPPGQTTAPSLPDEGRRRTAQTVSESVRGRPRKSEQVVALTREFEEFFWPKFPNKKAKIRALTGFVRARQKASLETIMDGLSRYIETKEDWREWMLPTTFLNQERWADEPAPVTEKRDAGNNRNSYRQDKKSLGEQVAELWLEYSGNCGDQEFGQKIKGEVPDGFLSRARIDTIGEEATGDIHLERCVPAFIPSRRSDAY